jgi:hypothetical protein
MIRRRIRIAEAIGYGNGTDGGIRDRVAFPGGAIGYPDNIVGDDIGHRFKR